MFRQPFERVLIIAARGEQPFDELDIGSGRSGGRTGLLCPRGSREADDQHQMTNDQ